MRFQFLFPLLASACLASALANRRDAAPSTITTTVTTPVPAIPSPTQPGLISSCNSYYKVRPDDTCLLISNRYGITLAIFYAWNPSVGKDCTSMVAGYYVCVGVPIEPPSPTTTSTSSSSTTTTIITPSPMQPGTVPNCNRFYKVLSGDTCISIVSKFSNTFTIETFEIWNPSIGHDCSNMWLGYWVCVGVWAS